ncbi:transposable element Tc1 transposase [Trichonephila clavipes]|nr:transposable element Tc1 transposase [Trichonephila clavipes]
MQDLSSIHTSKQTRKWLQERNVNVIHDWPPKGPDMNPVKNVWAEMVRRLEIHSRNIVVLNRDQLWEDILHVFYEIPNEYFENLVRSMPRRIRTVASKQGGWANDEAHFWLNGYVNRQNCRIWSEANPQLYVETPLHPEKLTVWCALWAGGILLQKR